MAPSWTDPHHDRPRRHPSALARQILVSQRLLRAVEALAEAEAVGELPLKGFSKPMPAYNVVGLKAQEVRGVDRS